MESKSCQESNLFSSRLSKTPGAGGKKSAEHPLWRAAPEGFLAEAENPAEHRADLFVCWYSCASCSPSKLPKGLPQLHSLVAACHFPCSPSGSWLPRLQCIVLTGKHHPFHSLLPTGTALELRADIGTALQIKRRAMSKRGSHVNSQ